MFLNQNNQLDRLWAATRPEEPSTEAFDRLWAEVSVKASQPEGPSTLSFVDRKSWGLRLAIFAQAAALLIAGFVALNRSKPSIEVTQGREIAQVQSEASVKIHDLRVKEGTTMFVSIDHRGKMAGWELRPETPESDTDVVAVESELLSFMESQQ